MKLINTERRKLINAILLFAKNLRHPTKVNIFKMLYFSDFEHFKKTGRSITGLEYFAWEYGPVPRELYYEMKDDRPPDDMKEYFNTFVEVDEIDDSIKKVLFKAKIRPNMKVFSEREKEILEQKLFIYKDVLPSEASKITHTEKEDPLWIKTIRTKGMNEKIDYLLALEKDASIDQETAEERMKFNTEMGELFG